MEEQRRSLGTPETRMAWLAGVSSAGDASSSGSYAASATSESLSRWGRVGWGRVGEAAFADHVLTVAMHFGNPCQGWFWRAW